MNLILGSAAGAKTITQLLVGTPGGNKVVKEGWIGIAGGLKKQFYSAAAPLTADASPDLQGWNASEIGKSGSGSYIFQADISVEPIGGVAPFTYAWQVVTGSPSITMPDQPLTGLIQSTGAACSVRCAVTDSLGTTVFSDTIVVT